MGEANYSGTTAVVALWSGTDVHVANVGDSSCVIGDVRHGNLSLQTTPHDIRGEEHTRISHLINANKDQYLPSKVPFIDEQGKFNMPLGKSGQRKYRINMARSVGDF